ncbi:MAG: hypothetical protein KA807_16780 [Prolixibacteraceae bacterium]|nr:hypothetical protein [Prolixibacteraceae bacterium]
MSNENDESKPIVSKKGGSINKVDPIQAAPVPNEKGWINIVKAFNPFGAMAESYAKTLAYRIECKRLDGEIQRVKVQAGVIHDALDKTFKLKMEELKQRRLELDRFYDTVQGQLKLLHIERMTVLKMAEKATDMVLAKDTSSSDRILFKELATTIIADIPNFGDKANASLEVLVKSLPRVHMPDRLLPSGGD